MSLTTSVHEIQVLIHSSHPLLVMETVEEERVRNMLGTVAAKSSLRFFEWSVTTGLVEPASGNDFQRITADPAGLLQHLGSIQIDAIFLLKDFAKHLDSVPHCRRFREILANLAKRRATVVITGSPIALPPDLESLALRFEISLPDEEELGRMVDVLLTVPGPISRLLIDIHPKDKIEIVRLLRGMTLNQARQAVAQILIEDGKFSAADLETLMKKKATLLREGGLLEFFPPSDNKAQLGGFGRLKEWLARAQVGFSQEARDLNLPAPKGVLIVGVQGCGKSLAAKCIAREWRLPLLKLDAGRLFDKFIGESEKNFRRAIQMAESMAPAVLWIDEIEKGMAPTGSSESDGGLSRRLFGTFLTWLQEKKKEVFVVATANDLMVLPPELLRKGRFDEIFFVDLPSDAERIEIWKIHLGLRKQDEKRLDLPKLVAATEGFSGAEIEQAVVASLYGALQKRAPLDTEILLAEISRTIPLSRSRAEDVARIRQMAKGRFVPVS